MNKRRPLIFPAALLVLSTGLVLAGEQDGRADVGVVERVQKSAAAFFAGALRTLQPASPVYFLDRLRTAQGSRLGVKLADGSKIAMGENAELVIDKFVYEPAGRREIFLNAAKGALLFVSDKLHGRADGKRVVRTPVAILGVRGTRFWVGPIDGATGVLVLDGKVHVSSAKGRTLLRPGEGTMVQEDGTLSARKIWGQAKVARALETVSFRNPG